MKTTRFFLERGNYGRYGVTVFARNLLDEQFYSGIGTGFLDTNATGAGAPGRTSQTRWKEHRPGC